jgi:hypothetical protein
MAKKSAVQPAEIDRINSAETSAISIIRSLPPAQRPDALKWFQNLAKREVIRKQILHVLESYVPKTVDK